MSYDLMVFDPDLAPRKAEVGDWHRDLMEADESDGAFDPASLKSNRLRAFYEDIRVNFPAMNGPDQVDEADVDDDQVTGYAFYPAFIYMDFRWSVSEPASTVVLALADKHGLGLFDPQDSDDGVMSMGSRARGSDTKTSWWARLFGR